MPKVLRIMNRLNLGGPTYNAAYLTRYLQPEFETMLLAGMKDDSEESSEFIVKRLGIEPCYIHGMKREISWRDDREAYKEIKNIIREFKPDIVHTHAAKSGALGRLAADACKVPVIIHTFHGHVFHSYFGPLKTQFFIQAERYLATKSSAIIAISNKQKDELANRFKICKEDKIRIIPLGFDLDRFVQEQDLKRISFRTKYQLADDEIAIGIIGRLVPVKNHGLFLEMLKNVSERTSKKIRAFIIGDGESRSDIEQKAAELGIAFSDANYKAQPPLLTFTSWIHDIDVAIAGLDIITLTSLNEGTPVSLIEAQAGGRPIVSTIVGGVEDVVINEKTAFLAASGDVQNMSSLLLKLVENDQLRQDMSSEGAKHSTLKFHVSSLVKNTASLYHELLLK